MQDAQLRQIVEPVLRRRFEPYGLRHLDVGAREDFDGDLIYRLSALVDRSVPTDELIQAKVELYRCLDDDGILFLNARTPAEIEEDEQAEEEVAD